MEICNRIFFHRSSSAVTLYIHQLYRCVAYKFNLNFLKYARHGVCLTTYPFAGPVGQCFAWMYTKAATLLA